MLDIQLMHGDWSDVGHLTNAWRLSDMDSEEECLECDGFEEIVKSTIGECTGYVNMSYMNAIGKDINIINQKETKTKKMKNKFEQRISVLETENKQ
ncbi:hypothetical protein ACF0H5_010031 [Mactra antiquata]